MSYERQEWKQVPEYSEDEATHVGEEHMTHIEDGIIANEQAIAEVKDTLTELDYRLSESITEISDILPLEVKDYNTSYELETVLGTCDQYGNISDGGVTRRRTDFINISECPYIGFPIEYQSNRKIWVRYFDENKVFTQTTGLESIGDKYELSKRHSYCIVVIKCTDPNDGSLSTRDTVLYGYKLGLNTSKNLSDVFVKRGSSDYSDSDIRFKYEIGDGYSNYGIVKLPPNYTVGGKQVPLVVFIHGSADYYDISATKMTYSYDDYYNFIRDNGYAVFDCYGWGTKYTSETGGSTNTWGLPINRKCYLSGISYLLSNYNIDSNNIFVACKSLGGLQALSMLFDESIQISAIGMFAPQLNAFTDYLGYQSRTKHLFASELGFTEDTNHVLDFNQGEPLPEGFWDYITENAENWIGNIGWFNGLPIGIDNISNYYNKATVTENMNRQSLMRPVKIWHSTDDANVSYSYSKAFIKSLQNSGCKAILRTLPIGTGGHHSMDTDANALKDTNVTTKLGIVYDTIPRAYNELVQWFDRFLVY